MVSAATGWSGDAGTPVAPRGRGIEPAAWTILPGEWGLRASDAERERTVALLRQAYTAGRLNLAELRDRAAAAYSAKTRGDLRRLMGDLPAAYGARLLEGEELETRVAVGYRGPERRICCGLLAGLVLFIMATAAWVPGAVVPLLVVFSSVVLVTTCWRDSIPGHRRRETRAPVTARRRGRGRG